MKQITWRCNKCDGEGKIEVPEELSLVWEIKEAKAAHDEAIPDCDNTLLNIIIIEVDREKEGTQ